MNIFLIRTRLQALIVEELIGAYFSKEKCIAVFYFQNSRLEDSAEIREIYERIRQSTFANFDIVFGSGFIGSTLKLYALNLAASLTGGKLLLAGIDGYPAALAARFCPFLAVNTFDDGAANILMNDLYYFDHRPLAGNQIKRRIMRWIFPNGCKAWFKVKTARHFTIFPDLPNIVDADRLVSLNWDWQKYLNVEDAKLLSTKSGNLSIILGTLYDNTPDEEKMYEVIENLMGEVDFYIMHPREKTWTDNLKAVRLKSPAESVLKYLSADRELTIYHFHSTVSFTMKSEPSMRFVDLSSQVNSNFAGSKNQA